MTDRLAAVLTVACPTHHAPAGETCWSLATHSGIDAAAVCGDRVTAWANRLRGTRKAPAAPQSRR